MTPREKERFAYKCLKYVGNLLPTNFTITPQFRFDPENAAACTAQPEYYRATININLEELKTKKAILAHVIHEICHIPTWPLYHVASELAEGDAFKTEIVRVNNELATTTLELMFMALIEGELL